MLALAILITACFALVKAQNSTAQSNTVNLLIDDYMLGKAGYVASVVEACADRTVYNLRCTSGTPLNALEPRSCGPDAPAFDLTEGPSVYIVTSVWERTSDQIPSTVVITVSCALDGTTAHGCHQTLTEIVGASTTVSVTNDVGWYYRYDVPITAGAEKTVNPTGTGCAAVTAATITTSPTSTPAGPSTGIPTTSVTTSGSARSADFEARNMVLGAMTVAGLAAVLSL